MREVVSTTMDVTRKIDKEDVPVEIFIDGWVDFTVEREYGSDADGNRGVKRVFVNDVSDLGAADEFGDDVVLSEQEKALAEENLVRKFLEG